MCMYARCLSSGLRLLTSSPDDPDPGVTAWQLHVHRHHPNMRTSGINSPLFSPHKGGILICLLSLVLLSAFDCSAFDCSAFVRSLIAVVMSQAKSQKAQEPTASQSAVSTTTTSKLIVSIMSICAFLGAFHLLTGTPGLRMALPSRPAGGHAPRIRYSRRLPLLPCHAMPWPHIACL